MIIGLMGDVHGNESAVARGLNLFKEQGIDTIVQLGDFGFWPGEYGQKFLNVVSEILTDNDQYLIVVPGNHEDYNQLKNLSKDEQGFDIIRTRIRVAPRGHRWSLEDVSFVALGGAPSVDRSYRVSQQRRSGHPLWWAEEAITDEDVEKTVSGGYADVMFAHDAPFGVSQIERHIGPNPFGFAKQDLLYALEGRERMRTAVEGVAPRMFFHGHYHIVIKDTLTLENSHEVLIRGLNADGKYGTYAILDLSDLSFYLIGD